MYPNAGWVGSLNLSKDKINIGNLQIGGEASDKEDCPRSGNREGCQNLLLMFTQLTLRGDALQTTALLDCEGSTPSGSRHPAPIDSRYETHLDTPPSDTEERSTLSCPMSEGTSLKIGAKTEAWIMFCATAILLGFAEDIMRNDCFENLAMHYVMTDYHSAFSPNFDNWPWQI